MAYFNQLKDNVKTIVILALALLPQLALAEIPKCSSKKVTLIGRYGDRGEFPSPLLEMWSEASGNLTALEIKASQSFTKAVVVFKDSEKTVVAKKEVPLKKNKGSGLNLISEVKKQKSKVATLEVQLFREGGEQEFCNEISEVIEKDAEGPAEGTNEKTIK